MKKNLLILLVLCFVLLNKGSFAQFVTVWKTDNAGTSASNQITIPTNTAYTYSYTVNWGDASSNTYTVNTPPTHTYATPGSYTVSITGNFPSIRFNDVGDKLKLLTISNWGTGTWRSFYGAFYGCANVVGTFTAAPTLAPATNLSYMFANCSVFNTDISNWNLSTVTNMSYMFYGATTFNQPIDIWNVSAVTDIEGMFQSASAFNQPIGTWNVSAVTAMSYMFYGATTFNQPIGTWNVGAVTDMSFMFYDATAFNQPIGAWNVAAVTNMSLMFMKASAFNQPIGAWNVGAVTNMNGMFQEAPLFNQPIGTWNVGAVTNMSYMFFQASAFNQPIGTWNVGAVNNMQSMFNNAIAFNQPIGSWNVGAVTNMIGMFFYATAFNQPIGSWNVSNVTTMSNMFLGVTLSNTNYHNLLIGWDALALKPSVNFHGGNSTYCSAAAIAARNNMTSSDLWAITDGGVGGGPTLTVNSGAICAGQSFTMVPSGALTYTYSNGSSIATPTSNVSYTVSGTDAVGCISANTVSSVTVNALPTISVNSGAICSGQSFTMVPSGASTYTYSNGSSVATPTANASYSISGTGANGCVSAANAVSNVTVNALPTISTTSSSICVGQSSTLIATTSGETVNWFATPTSTNVLASGNNYTLSPASSTTVYAQAANGIATTTVGLPNNSGGGSQQASTNYNIFDALTNFTLSTVEVYPGAIGNAIIELRNNVGTLITSTTVAITSTAGPITIPVNFAISAGTGYRLGQGIGSVSLFRNSSGVSYPYTLPGVVSITNSAAGSTFYYFFYKWNVLSMNATCLSTMSPAQVLVNTLPTISVNSGAICAGQSFTMVPTGAATFTYSNGSSVATPTADATYSVSGTDANGCENIAVSSVTVNALPTLSVNSGAICAGQSFTMVPSGAVTYTYSNGSSIATPTANASYNVSGTDANGCVSAANAVSNVTVNALPTLSVNSGAICAGQSFTMVPSGAVTYTYSNGSSVATPTANASYNVSGTDANGCISATNAVSNVTVNALPSITVNSGAICAGQSFTMVPSGAVTYTYSNGSDIATPTADATYSVNGTDANGCVSATDAVSNVTVNALPTISAVTSNTLLCTGETATLSVSGASTYTWSTTDNTTDVAVSPTVTTTYVVDGTDLNGCLNTTTIIQDVSLCTGIVALSGVEAALISVYPNPNNGLFVLELTTNAKVTVTNALGQIVISESFEAGKHNLNISNEVIGVYFVKVNENNKQHILKVIKQ